MLSDAHLTSLDDPAQRALVAFLDGVEADGLVIAGDLFHFWWGWEAVVQARYVPVCAALLRLRERGITLDFIPGNHDFAAGPFFREALGARVLSRWAEEVGGRQWLVVHGDEADRSLRYRTARRLLRGRPFAGLMRVLGPARGERLLLDLAGASRQRPSRADALLQAQQDWARRAFARGVDVVALGHVHVPRLVELPEGLVVHLGDWAASRTWLEVEDSSIRLRQGEGGRILASA